MVGKRYLGTNSGLPVIRPLLPVRGEGLISEGIQKGLSTALTC